jgi:hypothetical protein
MKNIHSRIINHKGNHFMDNLKYSLHFLKGSSGSRRKGGSSGMSCNGFEGTTIAEETIVCQTQPHMQKTCALLFSPLPAPSDSLLPGQ